MKKIFISYSHKDKDWVREWLVPKLENKGIQIYIDYRDFEIGVPSLVNMERAIEQCVKTILVLTPHWVDSEYAEFESTLLQTGDPLNKKKKFLPLMLVKCELPKRLGIFTYANFMKKSEYDFQLNRLAEQIQKDFEQQPYEIISYPILASNNVEIQRLPETGYELFGRQKELKLLNDAWDNPDTNIMIFVAYGGFGKSTLVKKWVEKMRWDNFRGAQKVFAWSFYSQGTNERITSAELFIDTALRWFGDQNPTQGSPWDKGKRLAELIRQQKTLLILDGLESLQSTLDSQTGKMKDPALSMLLVGLAKSNNGLCVITTREKIYDIRRYPAKCPQVILEPYNDIVNEDVIYEDSNKRVRVQKNRIGMYETEIINKIAGVSRVGQQCPGNPDNFDYDPSTDSWKTRM